MSDKDIMYGPGNDNYGRDTKEIKDRRLKELGESLKETPIKLPDNWGKLINKDGVDLGELYVDEVKKLQAELTQARAEIERLNDERNRYPNITKLFSLISSDNGGCTADEIESMLQLHIEDERNLEILAAGEEQERIAVRSALMAVADPNLVYALDRLLGIAFEGTFDEYQEFENIDY